MKNNSQLPIQVRSQKEADDIIYKMMQSGMNHRNILQTKFLLGGIINGINVAKLKQIKDSHSSTVPSKLEKRKFLDKDSQVAEIFKLIKKGISSTDIVIKTGLSTETVNKAISDYAEFENLELVPSEFFDELFEKLSKVRVCNDLNDVLNAIDKAVYAENLLRIFSYPCSYCKKPEVIGPNELNFLKKEIVSGNWGHVQCLEKNGISTRYLIPEMRNWK